ncbi:MAG: hypothetical protein QHI38_09185 [Armatimonadota bacterium]|nr:hypothetical protein [Armatimonadota bacterium]
MDWQLFHTRTTLSVCLFLITLSFVHSQVLAQTPDIRIEPRTRAVIADGRPFLPFGFYTDPDIVDLPEVESLNGFTTIAPYWFGRQKRTPDDIAEMRRQLDRCAAVNMKLNYDIKLLATTLQTEEDEQALRAEVDAVKDHPALLAWYIADEPELNNVPPERLVRAYKIIKEVDPVHPVAVCIAQVGRAEPYLPAFDVLLVDIYPIPHHSVTKVADGIEKALAVVGSSKPVWFIPQAFGGGEFWYREPTAKEVRAMTYLALIHGATGIQYFIRRPPIGNPKSPVVWSECRILAMECSQLAPAVLSGESAPRVSCEPVQIHARAFADRGMLFVLAVNTENRPTAIKIAIEGCEYSGSAELIFERRRVDVKSGVIEDWIDALGTRVYRLPVGPFPQDDISINPENIVANPSFEEIVSPGTPANCYIWTGEVRGANCTIDPYTARHGRQSVRMTVPSDGTGVTMVPLLLRDSKMRVRDFATEPMWFKYTPGTKLKFSVWAKAKTPGVKFRFVDGNLDGLPKTFTLTNDWQRYEADGVAKREMLYGRLGIQLIGPGTAWFDMFEVTVTENSVPKSEDGS